MKAVTVTSGRLWAAPVCPKCAALLDGFTGLDGAVPKPGSMTICGPCRAVLTFEQGTIGLQLREATPADWNALDGEERAILRGFLRHMPPLQRATPKGKA